MAASDLVPVYGDDNPVTAIAGDATQTACKIVVCALNDPTANAISFVCNGVTYTSGVEITMNQVGTDHGSIAQAGWVGAFTVSGLPSTFQRFTWLLTQGADTDSGSFTNNPEVTDEYMLFAGTCDNNTNFSNLSNNHPWTVVGYWKRIKSLMQDTSQPECSGLGMIDDIMGYVDTKNIDDTDSTAHATTGRPQDTLKEYDYFISWFAMMGMLGKNASKTSTDATDLNRLWGREVNRAWCRKNMNWRVGFGDHEFIDNYAWEIAVSDVPGQMHKVVDGDFLGAAYVAYNTIWGAINPDAISGASDTDASHWAVNIGNITLATFDGITNSSATTGAVATEPPDAFTSLYGSSQIDDVLGAINTNDTAFNILMMPLGMKYLSADNRGTDMGTAHPLYDHMLAEYKQLFTADNNAGNDSIMAGRFTNGAMGATIMLFGDLHQGSVQRHHSDADTNIIQEELYEFHLGTINGSLNHTQDSSIVEGFEFVNSKIKVDIEQHMADDVDGVNNNHVFQGHRFVHTPSGNGTYAELRVIVENPSNEVVWDKRFVQYQGNAPLELTEEIQKASSVGVSL